MLLTLIIYCIQNRWKLASEQLLYLSEHHVMCISMRRTILSTEPLAHNKDLESMTLFRNIPFCLIALRTREQDHFLITYQLIWTHLIYINTGLSPHYGIVLSHDLPCSFLGIFDPIHQRATNRSLACSILLQLRIGREMNSKFYSSNYTNLK